MLFRTVVAVLITRLVGAAIAAQPEVDPKQLPRVLPTDATNALATFRVKPGFRIELVAAEPLVLDPIALSFDEDERLYVVEMRDYSERRPERLGRIRLLEDTDGDGRFDKSTVFAKDLPWPTAVICWDGGVFVGATPDILYMKDTNGDGVADIREVIFTGFASDYAPFETNKLNVQALMNSFNWSLENRIHGATSFSGGKVKLVDTPFAQEWLRRAGVKSQLPDLNSGLDLRGRDFSFDPRTLNIRAESGGGQHGLSFDNAGRKYVCSNSSHIQSLIYEERYAARNPYYSMPRALVDIAVDGGAAPVYRISPDEPWRVIRTQWRVSGLVPGPIEGSGRPSGYFTGATGVTIYRGDAFGDEFIGDAFVADCGSNLVHRKKIRPDGVGVLAERPADEQHVEFLASADNWFRPVQLANGPDGALYICDMYREVIEHPWSLPESLKKHLDLNSGNDRGRIYRVVPTNFHQPKLSKLSQATTAELVKALESPNGWTRDTAARLIYERQDRSAVPQLIDRLGPLPPAYVVLHALCGIAGLGALTEEHVTYAMSRKEPEVREHAWKLAEPFLLTPSDELRRHIGSPIGRRPFDSGEASVLLQLVLSLGHARFQEQALHRWDPLSVATFSGFPESRLAQNDAQMWIESAVLSVLQEDAFAVFSTAVGLWARSQSEREAALVAKLARLVGASNRSNEISAAVNLVNVKIDYPRRDGTARYRDPSPEIQAEILTGLDDGLRQANSSLEKTAHGANLAPVYERLARIALSSEYMEKRRLIVIEGLATAPHEQVRTNLLPLLGAGTCPISIQKLVVTTLARSAAPTFANDLISAWSRLTPALRQESLRVMLERTERIEVLLLAIESGDVQASELSIAQTDALRNHRIERVRNHALEVLRRTVNQPRQEVIARFEPSLQLLGAASHGRTIYLERCSSCHRVGNEGYALGPDLATVRAAGKEKLLMNILDPNREVAPNFVAYSLDTKDGDSFGGIVVNESAASVTLRQANGIETVVARANISALQSEGKSLMPEGLEAGLSQQDMADLLEFIINPAGGK
jgi:putative membrane-bound dehydrogenase-like protein